MKKHSKNWGKDKIRHKEAKKFAQEEMKKIKKEAKASAKAFAEGL